MRAHVIEDGRIVNTIEVESLDFLPGLVDASAGGRIGDAWDGASFSSPAPVVSVPASVTRRQAKQALRLAGKLDLVQPAIDAIADPLQRGLMQDEWDDSQVFERHRPALLQMAAALGMSGADLDQLFITAAGL